MSNSSLMADTITDFFQPLHAKRTALLLLFFYRLKLTYLGFDSML